MIREQIDIFFAALIFYTRIPCPKWVTHDQEYLNKATVYFPAIGWIVGILSFLAFWLASLLFSPLIAVLLSMVASILVTGAFHEDGFADTCDGFGGGWTKERILLIMKDSRVGTYGVVGLVFILGIKTSALAAIVSSIGLAVTLFVFLTAHSLSRAIAATTLYTHTYSRENDDSKAKPLATKMNKKDLLIVSTLGLVPLLGWVFYEESFSLLLILIPAYVSKALMAKYFQKWINGYTGDCLGAIQQTSEVLIYLTILVIWRFI
jgi:adenosylcobinamide-GDP ribazoletransferase